MGRAETARAGAALLLAAAIIATGGCAHRMAAGAASAGSANLPEPNLNAYPGYQAAGSTTATETPRPTTTSARLAADMRANAPARYIVQKGDTLWAIAGYYLKDPWLWPQLWHANPDIGNPNLIYPGDVLVLTRDIDGTPRLTRDGRVSGNAVGSTIYLSPQVRVEPLSDAIPVIPASAIRVFLNTPQRVNATTLKQSPYIVALDNRQLIAATGMTAYVTNLSGDHGSRYEIVRPEGFYIDPQTHANLGRKVVPIGQLQLDDDSGATKTVAATITNAQQPIRAGDRLLPMPGANLIRDFHPHAPSYMVSKPIISQADDGTEIGQFNIVALADNQGSQLTRGDVLDIYQPGQEVPDPVAGGQAKLPPQKIGELMVFKNDGPISYALVMHAIRAIHTGDIACTPNNP